MARSTTFCPGASLGGYRLERRVGSGSFAEVWEAHTRAGERVAVKVLTSSHPQARQRFLREIKVLESIPSNPHVVRFIDKGEAQGALFLVQEFVDGCTIGQLLATKRRFSEQAACALLQQLCGAFAGLHRLGLTHGDIKPNNIMVQKPPSAPSLGSTTRPTSDTILLSHVERSELSVKLLDFGMARDSQGVLQLLESVDGLGARTFVDDLDAGTVAGTPEYMAPEQFRDALQEGDGGPVTDTPADVFALGVVFCELLTGRVPWPFPVKDPGASGLDQAVERYVNERLTAAPPTAPQGLSPALWSILARALSHDPATRQSDAIELGRDIARYSNFGAGVTPFEDTEETTVIDMRTRLSSDAPSTGPQTLNATPSARARAARPIVEDLPPSTPTETPSALRRLRASVARAAWAVAVTALALAAGVALVVT